uniref:Metallo-beta-lactamase domain-containing protein n=1 Tax=Oryza rufipogon TaxID=4529 RepID=A0A0E0RK10_ORYRU
MASSVPNGHGAATATGEGGTPPPPPPSSSSSLVFLGTGCSSAVPNARCLIQPPDPPCAVCSQSLSVAPELNPNYRCNTSLLIDYCQDENAHKYILIDVGKTFREQVLRWFVHHKIPCVDSIILTHEHADAILGLDDVRIVQSFSPTNDIEPTPIYLSQFAMDSIAQKFPYLVRKKLKEGEEVRRVAQLDWRVIESDLQIPFVTSGLEFVPLPVIHGEDYICLGFLFGRKSKVAYISDVSWFPPSTEHGHILYSFCIGCNARMLVLIGNSPLDGLVLTTMHRTSSLCTYAYLSAISKSGGGQLDLLILDCLSRTLDAVKRICPKRALLIGMTDEMDHHKDNETLEEWSRREGIDVQLARDGSRYESDRKWPEDAGECAGGGAGGGFLMKAVVGSGRQGRGTYLQNDLPNHFRIFSSPPDSVSVSPPLTDSSSSSPRSPAERREASSSPPMAASVPNGHSVAGEGGTPAPPPSSSSLVFLGTGCSSAVPNARCLIQPPDPPCAVCSQSLSVPPELNPNYRCNTSLLIDYCQDEVTHKYILIDVGKTFREQIILTHEHADAILGLDDVRIVQPFSPTNDIEPTPIYLSQFAMNSIAQKFPYLVRKKLKEGEEVRRVAQLDWRVIESDLQKPFVTSGLEFVPLPVIHGEDYVCLGFLFGRKSKVAYISDVSRFPPSTEHAISKSGEGQLDLLILDCLYRTLDAVKRICPKRALLIGMTHEMDHHKDNETLEEWSRREGIDVQLARDGLRVYIDLGSTSSTSNSKPQHKGKGPVTDQWAPLGQVPRAHWTGGREPCVRRKTTRGEAHPTTHH